MLIELDLLETSDGFIVAAHDWKTFKENCLDFKEWGEIADNLNYLYRHIRFSTKIYIEKDKVDLMQSALFVSNEILEGWKGISSKVA